MSTRGAYGFRVDGVDKVTYNHCDSYPSALGAEMVRYVQARSDGSLKKAAKRLVVVADDSRPTQEQINAYLPWLDRGVGEQSETSWYCLLRHAQGNPDAWHRGLGHMIDGSEFLADSVFCEYAYIVNVDDGVLEFYKGFNKDRKAPGRYAALEREKRYEGASREYGGVALVEAAPLWRIRRTRYSKVVKRWDDLTRGDDE